MERAQKKVESRNFDIRKSLIKFDDVMNDQRQVIFSQRLKILKNENIEGVLSDFLDEISMNLDKFRDQFQKSNDKKKYLTSIKNSLGNVINDDELLGMTSLNQEKFITSNFNVSWLDNEKII